jgi:uncharacterized membrane protein YuzA (DUF378 family)
MHNETHHYYKKQLFAFAMLFLVIGGINWGIMSVTGTNLVKYLTGKNTLVANAIFLLVGLSALFIGFARDSYLPFLGPSVMPCSLLKVQTPEGADFEKRFLVKPGVKVLYWAAEPNNSDLQTITNWQHAYLAFRNAGVAVSDDDGYVKLRVRKPQPYTVPTKGEIHPHIHFRVCMNNGFIGPVETVSLDTNEFFENVRTTSEPEPVTAPSPIEYPNPETSMTEVNRALQETQSASLMPTEGALVESILPQTKAADYNEAFPISS